MTEEEVKPMAPGLIQAYAPEEPEEKVEGRRPRRRNQDDPILALRKWVPNGSLEPTCAMRGSGRLGFGVVDVGLRPFLQVLQERTLE